MPGVPKQEQVGQVHHPGMLFRWVHL